MAIDYVNIEQMHVKDISREKFTVFITEPMYMECEIAPLPYCENQDVSVAYKHTSGLVLNANGYFHAKRALEALQRKAEFIVAHKDEFGGFLDEYHKEYDKISAAVQEARFLTQKARNEADWHAQPELFRKQIELEKKKDSLYHDMYMARFGKDAFFLYEEDINALLSKL